jgi:hypothetical protein
VAKLGLNIPARRNGRPLKEQPKVSELGRELERLRARYVAGGGKLLNRRELEREIAERRGLK